MSSTAQFAPIHIRLVSGEIQTIDVDVKQYIHVFPKDYANKFGYNPKVTHRFEFLIQSEENDEHEHEHEHKQIRLLDASEKTWLQRFSTVDDIPLIHLLIQSDNDKDLPAKIALIHSIAKKQRCKFLPSDEEITSHYQQWYLTYCPSGKTNRYITLSDFVHASPELFPVYSLEEIQEYQEKFDILKREYDETQRLYKFTNDHIQIYDNVLVMQHHTREYMNKIAHFTPLQMETHEAHKAELRTLLDNDPDCLFVHQMLDKINLYKETIGCCIMMEMGVYNAGFKKINHKCDCGLQNSKKECSKLHMKFGKQLFELLAEFRSELLDENDIVIHAKIEHWKQEPRRLQKHADSLWDKMEPLRDILFV
jgi:hypothetical protein